ncbi:MAG: class I SAM-dependent methyltransferase [Anaerolineales bacterium]|nr:class I SAM-dependent methyltransferase [Anaerolineales bacterium]
MLTRIDSFFDHFNLSDELRIQGQHAAALAGERAKGMTTVEDYEALAAIALYFRPQKIFEIGTYLGITSDFFLELLPDCSVVSITYQNPERAFLRKVYNNSGLPREQAGSAVASERRTRFVQLLGDSHKLKARKMTKEYGFFDLVFIDGDHSYRGVSKDTELAKKLIAPFGVICWHDANPKEKYLDVRRFLEQDLVLNAVATRDNYLGGIACWSTKLSTISLTT